MNVFGVAVSASAFAHIRMPTESRAERLRVNDAKKIIGYIMDRLDEASQALQTKTNYLSSRAEQHYLNKKNE